MEAGGFQPIEAYDVLIANLDTDTRTLRPAGKPERAARVLQRGLCTQEVAVLLAGNLIDPDRAAAEEALIDLAARGRQAATPLAATQSGAPQALTRATTISRSAEPRIPVAAGS